MSMRGLLKLLKPSKNLSSLNSSLQRLLSSTTWKQIRTTPPSSSLSSSSSLSWPPTSANGSAECVVEGAIAAVESREPTITIWIRLRMRQLRIKVILSLSSVILTEMFKWVAQRARNLSVPRKIIANNHSIIYLWSPMKAVKSYNSHLLINLCNPIKLVKSTKMALYA